MGNSNSAEAGVSETLRCPEELWPYVWAIEEPEVLDWKLGKSVSFSEGDDMLDADIIALAAKQSKMPVEITDHVYLSDHQHICDIDALKQRGITHVLNVGGPAARGPLDQYKSNDIIYKEIVAEDEYGYPMLRRHMDESLVFFDQAQARGGKAVVHCAAGINRSGVIVAAYYMLAKQTNVLDAVAHCRRQRGNCFLWNHSFQVELVHLARDRGLLGPPPGPDTGSCVSLVAPPYTDFEEKDEIRRDKNKRGTIANIFKDSMF